MTDDKTEQRLLRRLNRWKADTERANKSKHALADDLTKALAEGKITERSAQHLLELSRGTIRRLAGRRTYYTHPNR